MTRTRSKEQDNPPQPPTRSIKTRSMSIKTRSMVNTTKPPKKRTQRNSLSNPTVVVPSLKTQTPKPSDPPKPPPNETLQEPCSSKLSASSSSLNLPSHTSQLPRLIPPHPKPKKETTRKRLFEDVDNSSNDIFSFLDHPSTKPTKPTRRTVFKSTQPSFLRSNNRIAPETDATKNKHRVLASTKLLAGSQPQAKRLKKTLPQTTSSTTPTVPQEPVNSKPDHQPEPSSSKLQSTCDPPSPPPPKTNDENCLSTQTTNAPILSKSDQLLPTSVMDGPQPIIGDPSSFNLTSAISVSSTPISTDQPTSDKPPSIHPLLVTLCSSTASTPPLVEQPIDQSTETSVDAIDFLSPKKKLEQTRTNLEKPSECVCDNLAQVQSSEQINPPDSNAESERNSPPLEIKTTESITLRSDEKIIEQDSPSQLDPKDQSSVTNTASSPKPEPASTDHLLQSTQASNDQVEPSRPPSPVVDASLAPAIEETHEPPSNSSSAPVQTPVTPVTPTRTSSISGGAVSPIRAECLENKVESISTTPRSSPKLIPKRTSPIKHPTLPTSIPIMKPMPPSAPQGLPSNQLSGFNQPVSSRPSMLPRRALKPVVASQPVGLDAIIEASPEKRPVRDALSAASLNRSRGFGAPPRMIFTGGIKAKAESVFSRPITGCLDQSFAYGSLSGIIKPSGESHVTPPQESNQQTENNVNMQLNPSKGNIHVEEGTVAEEEGEDNRLIDTSSTSIATQNSTASSNLSSRTNPQSENNQQQFSGNISLDTQDRLIKLQNMLTRMGRSEANESSSNNDNNNTFQRQQYTEYEVDLKNNDDEDDEDNSHHQRQTGEASYSMRSCRRRSSSVPLNYSENPTTSKASTSRSQSVLPHGLITTTNNTSTSHKNQSKAIPAARRRVSNILPSTRVDPSSQLDSSATLYDQPSASSSTGTRNPNPKRNATPLKNVVAFVDVRTAEGDDAGKVFVEMLKGLGAKVVGRPVFPLTHMIFKAGKQSTIERYMMHPRPKPQLVGIGWIVRCREILSKADEAPYKIDINSSQVPFNLEQNRPTHIINNNNNSNSNDSVGNNNAQHSRRKSMEPKALSLLNSAIQLSSSNVISSNSSFSLDSSFRHPLNKSVSALGEPSSSSTTIESNNNNNNQDAARKQVLAQNIDKARRKSLQFLPKVEWSLCGVSPAWSSSSPLRTMERTTKNPPASQEPNQHHAIQYSAKFTPDTASKNPLPLAHFMGARRDLNGPILTKQRVDDKEVRPDGWELAEKRSQLAHSQSSSGVSSLASFLSGGSHMSSHAANLSKRALPGMTPSSHSSPFNKSLPQSDQPKPIDPPKPTSHAASYLKPKTLADRLAQLGVSHDVKLNPPAASHQQADRELESEPVQSDLSRNVQRITKSISAKSFPAPNLLEEPPPDTQHQRPLSVQILPTRGALPSILSPRNINVPQISPIHDMPTPTDPSFTRPGETVTSQPTGGPSYKRNQRPHSTIVLPPTPAESTTNLSIPSKSMTASLSRLAGSNIVAQRLQWSKEKEQLGTMDEFGNPLAKTSPNLGSPNLPAQIPSPVLPGLNNNPAPTTTTAKNLESNRVFLERNKNSNLEPSGVETNSTPQFKLSPRLQFPPKLETHPVKSFQDPMKNKNINQFNKSVRRSDEVEDDEIGPNYAVKDHDNLHRDNKRKNENLESSAADFSANKKKDHWKSDRSIVKSKQDILQSSPNSPSSSPRFPSTNKFRGSRGSHRQSSSSGSTHSSAMMNNNHQKNRIEVINKMTSPTSNSSARQLPSIPSFSPLMKKGTSELAAVWGTQLNNSNKKNNPTVASQNNRPPLPIPPSRPKASTAGGAVDGSRPLPVPPSPAASSLNLDMPPRSRPLPVPQVKSPEPSVLVNLEDKAKTGSFKHHGNDIDASMVWLKYQDQLETFLPEFHRPNEQIEVKIFQLNRTRESKEFSTTSLDPQEYGIFFSQERLLIILKLKSDKKMVLLIWKGSDVTEDEDDLETRAKIERLLKKYEIDRRSKLLLIRHGYEPPELVRALGGKLILRKGDRYDSVYQRTLSSIFICKSFVEEEENKNHPSLKKNNHHHHHKSKTVVIIEEENILENQDLTDIRLGSFLCSGYSSIIKVYNKSTNSFSLFIWRGNFSSSLESHHCRLLAADIRNEVSPVKVDVEEVLDGNEPSKLLQVFGKKSSHFATSYHWRYKEIVPMTPMITDEKGEIRGRISMTSMSIIWTGLEIWVIVPQPITSSWTTTTHKNKTNNNNKQLTSITLESSLKLAHSISLFIPPSFIINHNNDKKIWPVHALLFPSVVPIDLLASVRFSNDLLALNRGFGIVDKMNLVEIHDFF